jgi:hypothetical protein
MRSLVVGTTGALLLAATAAGPVAAAPPSPGIDVHVVDASGHAIPHARVALAVMPSGRRVAPGRVAAARRTRAADAHGLVRWSNLSLTPRESRLATANGGWLNLTALVLDAAGQPIAATSLSRYVGSAAASVGRSESAAVVRVPGTAGAASLRDAAGVRGAATTSRQGPTTSRQGPTTSRQGATTATCTWPSNYRWELDTTSTAWTAIGELHVAGDSKATLTYGRTADSSIDAAFKVGGTWSLGGSVHIGNSNSTSVSETLGPYLYRHVLSRFSYGLWKLYSDCAEGWHIYRGYDHTEATRWVGGITYDTTSISYYDNHRTAYWNLFGRNSSFSRSTSTFAKVQLAVTVFGVNLGAQSGSSVNVTTRYDFGAGRSSHYLYGQSAYPSNAPVINASDA